MNQTQNLIEPQINSNKVNRMLKEIQQKLTKQISIHQITISPSKKPYFKPPNPQKVQMQQRNIPKSHSHNFTNSNAYCINPRMQSQFSESDASTLKVLLKEHKDFQKKMKAQTKKYKKWVERVKKEEQELRKKQKEDKKEHRKQILFRKKELNKLKYQRIPHLQHKNSPQFKNSNRLYLRWEADWHSEEIQLSEERLQDMHRRIKQKQLDLSALKNHSRSYSIHMKYKQQERLKRINKIKRFHLLNEKELKKQDYITRYHTLLLKEDMQKKHEQYQQKEKKANMLLKKREFSERLRKQHPLVYSKQQNDEDTQKRSLEGHREAMGFVEQRMLGNQYLKESFKVIDRKHRNKSEIDRMQPVTNSTKFSDHLTQSRKRREKMGEMHKASDQKDSFQKELEEVKRLMKSKLGKQERNQRILQITKKIESAKDDEGMQEKIAAKLKILESID